VAPHKGKGGGHESPIDDGTRNWIFTELRFSSYGRALVKEGAGKNADIPICWTDQTSSHRKGLIRLNQTAHSEGDELLYVVAHELVHAKERKQSAPPNPLKLPLADYLAPRLHEEARAEAMAITIMHQRTVAYQKADPDWIPDYGARTGRMQDVLADWRERVASGTAPHTSAGFYDVALDYMTRHEFTDFDDPLNARHGSHVYRYTLSWYEHNGLDVPEPPSPSPAAGPPHTGSLAEEWARAGVNVGGLPSLPAAYAPLGYDYDTAGTLDGLSTGFGDMNLGGGPSGWEGVATSTLIRSNPEESGQPSYAQAARTYTASGNYADQGSPARMPSSGGTGKQWRGRSHH
jgi:hypothetical protein